MLTRTTFAVVLVNDQSPWLLASFEALCDVRDRVRLALGRRVVVIKCYIDVSPFVIRGLWRKRELMQGK